MTDDDTLNRFVERLCDIEVREQATAELNIWLMGKGVSKQLANDFSTACNQLDTRQILAFAEKDEWLMTLVIDWITSNDR